MSSNPNLPPSSDTCQVCGNPLPEGSPLGKRCPSCMLAAGLNPGGPYAVTGASDNGPVEGERSVPLATHATGNSWQPPAADILDQAFPQMNVIELCGKGGMGAVYRAKQTMLDRQVALKILSPEISSDPRFADRFLREARALAQLSHPGIVTVYDFGRQGEMLYLVMEFIDGVNLREAMQAEAITPEAALEIVLQVCDALQYAHSEGVVHRDIKPENILMERSGRIRLVDFGLAKLIGDSEGGQLTSTNQIMGTMHYMAPEQWEHPNSVDHRVDIYSLGVVLYELLTGSLPLGRFKLPSEAGMQPQAGLQREVLDSVVLKTLERSPQDRYQHVSEVNADISRVSEKPQAAAAHGASGAAVASFQPAENQLPNPVEPARHAGSSTPESVDASGGDPRNVDSPPAIPVVVRNYDPGFVLGGIVLVIVGFGLLTHGLLTGFTTMWIGIGITLNGFVYFMVCSAPQAPSWGAEKTRSRQTLAAPNLGFLVHGFSMVWVGAVLSPAGFGTPYGWVGMGMLIGGAHVLIPAWTAPKKGKRVRRWNAPDFSVLAYASGMMLVGSVLLIAGILMGHGALPWVGLGLTVGGGSIAQAAWLLDKRREK